MNGHVPCPECEKELWAKLKERLESHLKSCKEGNAHHQVLYTKSTLNLMELLESEVIQ